MLFKSREAFLKRMCAMAQLYDIDFKDYYTIHDGLLLIGSNKTQKDPYLDIRANIVIKKDVVFIKFYGVIRRMGAEETPEALLEIAKQIRNGARFIQKLNETGVCYIDKENQS
jgi:7-cyano-7-deazaguanine synthase in queuosine biosynthesis